MPAYLTKVYCVFRSKAPAIPEINVGDATIRKGDFRKEIPFCDSHGARTHDPNIKSVVLYQLS